MPSVDVAMARSLRGGVWGSIAESLDLSLAPRDLADVKGKATDVKTAFSSWDNCMNASYCKWPVIAIIVVGSLFLLSIIWCIVRCACCGLSCCCECCACLKCCGNCMGCCDPPRDKRHKYLDNETVPPTNYGYRPEPPMKPDYGASRAAPSYDPPQYAEFDIGRKGGEDSLPSMPTWDSGGSRKVGLEDDSVEMNSLNKPANSGQSVASASAAAAASAAAVAAAAGASSPQRRPIPYRQPSPMAGSGGGPYATQDQYSANQSGYGYDHSPYGHGASQSGGDQYGAVAAVPSGLRKPSPRPENGYDGHQGYDGPRDAPDYAQTSDPYYAPGARQPSPASVAYAVGRTGHSPAPPADFGQAPQRYGSPAGFRPTYAEDQSSISNSGGFDFNSGYTRAPPQQPFAHDSPYERRGSPAQLTPSNAGYSAYSPYSQQQQQQQQRGAW